MLRFDGYLSAVAAGYPMGYAWRLLLGLADHLGLPERVHREGQFAPNAKAEVFFVFSVGPVRLGIVLVDRIPNPQEYRAAAARAIAAASTPIDRFILTCHDELQNIDQTDGIGCDGVVVSDDPAVAVARILELLNLGSGAPRELEGEKE